MTRWLRLFRVVAALALILAVVCQGTLVLAGTTGTLSGTITDAATHQPLSGAKVTAISPSQSATATTDGAGHFVFLALPPDTYTVTVSQPGYDQASVSGETVIADGTRTVSLSTNKALQTIGKVTSRAATELVKPGTTADVYSINATQQDKSAALGGGGNLNSAWSALASVPGVFVTPGQAGYIGAAATLSIRGGDYDQIGYEIDGVPVNRAFDNYPSGAASSLGQQELQVYTGAAPANAEAQGLSGFINQVIKTGTAPAYTQITGDLGAPAYYHKFSIETGGSNPSRNFSYYIGLGGYNQDYRYADQYNGQGVGQLYGVPLAVCSPGIANPSCYTNGVYNGNTGALASFGFDNTNGALVLGGANLFQQSSVSDRDNVVNLHFGFPHKNGTKDDIQLLYVNNHIATQYYDSTNDQGGLNYYQTSVVPGAPPTYLDGYQFNGPLGVPLNPATAQSLTSIYYFPNSGSNRTFGGLIPVDLRDGISNNQAIAKIQYTHAIGENALLKVYGYTYYSDWLQNGPQSAYSAYNVGFNGPAGPDYELSSHTRGVSATFTDQLGGNNLLSLQGAYTSASTLRDNNTQWLNGVYGDTSYNARTVIGALVDSSAPLNGLCYTLAGAPVSCAFHKASDPGAAFATIGEAFNGTIPTATGTCGGGPCEFLTVGNGQYATYNTVKPKFSSVSLTDQWKPTSKLSIDAGIRLDRYEFEGSDTTGSAARTFWYNAYNLDNCVTTAAPVAIVARAPGAACPAGSTPANFVNPSGNVTEGYNVYQPRFGFTYSLNPATVFRGSYGRFGEAPNSAYQQYNMLQQDAPALLYGTYGFQAFGFQSPNHTVVPPTSNNLDFSLEHQFGSDLSIKVSPFLRKTQNQIQNFYLNQPTGFVSGLNVGKQTSQGFEVEVDKGNFGRNGIAAKLSLAYTNSYINYQKLSNGTTVIDPLNAQIQAYNSYTSFCHTNTASKLCASTTPPAAGAAPCYTTTGAADFACAATSVANPYWNAPVQPLMDVNGSYPTFDILPAGIGSSVAGYGAPYTATFLLQYKRDKLAITPAVQFFGGQRYGAPATTFGVEPDTCTKVVGPAAGDPRYNYGAVGGSGFDFNSCGGTLTGGIPDPYTGKFDTIGAFVEPSQLQLHLQIAYDVTPRVSVVFNLANLVNTCFGGSKTGFTVTGACSYNTVAVGAAGDVGNLYNPGTPLQPYVNTPYEPAFAVSPYSKAPFGVFGSVRIKL